ncbi:MAG: hypothetical protein COV60_02405 [Candidatus Magasanikbacteria bacterium CG11_big_fil_rev_8_21_14_0_20_43_7]|uniref:Uncharacterized protein n=1 Tax=Candidatus Magasanikbacteria bacterium CG11_big_fil_rev_8_21_14_0_20_43_7 TaxID=1974654 RepID=A0A2H0N4L2_9BACT|nr:MAG: hypothetical protein COV60_02405 [Candidatus Magasanikbacteria bacterium CG11_big_fil_rev_8_21_14_0_20_43_7]
MVIKHYRNRIKCGTTAPLCELPKSKDIEAIIDWDFYDDSLTQIEKSKNDTNQLLREVIVPNAISKRLKAYEVTQNVHIFTEKELRNRASLRLKSSNEVKLKSWLPIAKKTGLLTSMKLPAAEQRGIYGNFLFNRPKGAGN